MVLSNTSLDFESLTLDNSPSLVSESVLDLLIIEAVHTIETTTKEIYQERKRGELGASGSFSGDGSNSGILKDELLSEICEKVDEVGYHAGINIAESKFHWFVRISGSEGGLKAAQAARPYMRMPCGIIRGILEGFGIRCTVSAETAGLPQCTFHIKIAGEGSY
ncbi:hypothetical protein H4219_004638 [Mycoemilia scoparia]|uniref:Uncharacterized protein n=1 Tax=Mycoemilia scoparia TaxID=417184 RepID=A0A9W7ZR10_9FUNG|nr:hypothetical protein H4219_004638 [Mycoemilia scoparia]